MLDNTKFSVTFENISDLKEILNTFSKIHDLNDKHFYISGTKNNTSVNISWCHPLYKEKEHYPLNVILPMIEYKTNELDRIADPYIGYDGSSIKAFLIEAKSNSLSISRIYLYAGK